MNNFKVGTKIEDNYIINWKQHLKTDLSGYKPKNILSLPYIHPSYHTRKKIVDSNVCPRSSDPFHIVSYCIKLVTTSWTHSMLGPGHGGEEDGCAVHRRSSHHQSQSAQY